MNRKNALTVVAQLLRKMVKKTIFNNTNVIHVANNLLAATSIDSVLL